MVAVTDSCSSNKHPLAQRCTVAKAKCELKQAKNMHPGFVIAFGNNDGKIVSSGIWPWSAKTWIFIGSTTRL